MAFETDHTPQGNSHIQSYAYDPESRTLRIAYKGKDGGRSYDYADVPQEKFDDMHIAAQADDISTGVWVNENIKGVFEHASVD